MAMEIVNEMIIDHPIPIIDGKVTIEIPEWGCRVIAPVKQVKGQGTHDAKNLAGLELDDWHKRIIMKIQEEKQISVENLRLKITADFHFKEGVTMRTKQAAFQRKHSELLYFGIIEKCGMNGKTPIYCLNQNKASDVLLTGRFPNDR